MNDLGCKPSYTNSQAVRDFQAHTIMRPFILKASLSVFILITLYFLKVSIKMEVLLMRKPPQGGGQQERNNSIMTWRDEEENTGQHHWKNKMLDV